MPNKSRFPCWVLLVPLLCCLCVTAGGFLLIYSNPIGLMSYLVEGGLQSIDLYPTAPPRDAQATVLFSDDFSDPDSGWRVGEWNDGRADYQNGGYRFEVSSATNMRSQISPSLPSDISLEVDVSVASASNIKDAGDFGVICRYEDNNGNESGHEFTFGGEPGGFFPVAFPSIDTFVGAGKVHSEESQYKDSFLFPSAWGRAYHMRADCIGDELSLYVNGYLVQRALSSNHSAGTGIGLFAGHTQMTSLQYVFDNLVVYEP